jgi:tRNA nucleotidyltransferase (CCA-adding enzyme)
MRDTGVMAVLFPELAPMIGFEQRSAYHSKTTDEHTFDAVQAAANMQANHAPLRVRLALLFHDAGKPHTAWIGRDGRAHYYAPDDKEWARLCDAGMYSVALPKPEDHEAVGARIADAALRRLGASNSLRNDVTTLVRRHMLPLHQNVRPTKVRYWRAELGDEMLRDLIVHRLADVIGKGGDIHGGGRGAPVDREDERVARAQPGRAVLGPRSGDQRPRSDGPGPRRPGHRPRPEGPAARRDRAAEAQRMPRRARSST